MSRSVVRQNAFANKLMNFPRIFQSLERWNCLRSLGEVEVLSSAGGLNNLNNTPVGAFTFLR